MSERVEERRFCRRIIRLAGEPMRDESERRARNNRGRFGVNKVQVPGAGDFCRKHRFEVFARQSRWSAIASQRAWKTPRNGGAVCSATQGPPRAPCDPKHLLRS